MDKFKKLCAAKSKTDPSCDTGRTMFGIRSLFKRTGLSALSQEQIIDQLDDLHQQNKERFGANNYMFSLLEKEIFQKQFRSIHLITEV